jgi:hypothetical protein
MYRYFAAHHTVVALDELVKRAIDMITEENEDIARLFHWSSYESGGSTDDRILASLLPLIDTEKYRGLRALIDRRYLPVSMFKSTPDQGKFVAEVMKQAKVKDDQAIRWIIEFFKTEDGGKKIQERLGKMKGDIAKCEVVSTAVMIKTYQALKLENKVWLYRNSKETFCELLTESNYLAAVNEEWKNYNGLYVYYLVPGRKKEEYAPFKEQIRKIMAEEIADYYRS